MMNLNELLQRPGRVSVLWSTQSHYSKADGYIKYIQISGIIFICAFKSVSINI
jgi:hypothetical protein